MWLLDSIIVLGDDGVMRCEVCGLPAVETGKSFYCPGCNEVRFKRGGSL